MLIQVINLINVINN